MSYNTRRSGDNLGNIGQRRNAGVPTSANFVSGGQLRPPNLKPGVQQNQQQQNRLRAQVPPTNNVVVQQSNHNQLQQPQQTLNKPQQQPAINKPQQQQHQTPLKAVVVLQNTLVKQESASPALPMQTEQIGATLTQQQTVAAAAASAPNLAPNELLDPKIAEQFTTFLEEKSKKVPPWLANRGKISKKQRQHRRNLQLGKILQPKNAVMILNELNKTATAFTVTEIPNQVEQKYKAVVVCGDREHEGIGRSKMDAKNAAAENALKYLIKSRSLTDFLAKTEPGVVSDGADTKMDTTEDDNQLPLQHVASFALYKLLLSWGEDINSVTITNKTIPIVPQPPGITGTNDLGAVNTNKIPGEQRPSKKMPADAANMNPVMLVNQMLPNVVFEQVDDIRSVASPNPHFTYKCTIDNKTFNGSASSKKGAKKAVAYSICNELLNVKYPPDVWTPETAAIEPMVVQ